METMMLSLCCGWLPGHFTTHQLVFAGIITDGQRETSEASIANSGSILNNDSSAYVKGCCEHKIRITEISSDYQALVLAI